MNNLSPGMVRTVYQRIKQIMYHERAVTLDRWMTIRQLVEEGFDQSEVEEAISLLYHPGGLFYEKHLGKIALVN